MRERGRTGVVVLWEKHDDFVLGGVLEIAKLSHVHIAEHHDRIGAPVEINVEAARFGLTRSRNVEEALVSQLGALGVEGALVDGVQAAVVLVLIDPVHALETQHMREDLTRHIVPTVVDSAGFRIFHGAGEGRILLEVRRHAVGEDMHEVINPSPLYLNTLHLEPLRRDLRVLVQHHVILDSGIEEDWLIFHACGRILDDLHTHTSVACISARPRS